MKRLSTFVVLVATSAMLVSACGTAKEGQGSAPDVHATDGNATQETQGTQGTSTAKPDQPKEQTQEAKKQLQLDVYYADVNLSKLEREKREITFTEDKEKYAKAMAMLGRSSSSQHVPLWKNFSYHAITLDSKGMLIINAKGSNVYNLGAEGEQYAIDALKRTMFQFPEVKQIVLLKDGKPTDSLMGHVDASQPFTR